MAERRLDGWLPTRFKDRLRVPPLLRPAQGGNGSPATLRVRMVPRRRRLHSELPPTLLWTYEGHLPGPTIEVRRGQALRVEWVNALPARSPYPVTAVTAPDPANRLPYPDVMEFRVSPRRVDDAFVLPRRLSPFRRLSLRRLPPGHVVGLVTLVEHAGMLTLRELDPLAPGHGRPGEPTIDITDDRGVTTRYRTVAIYFEDTTNWFVAYGATEVWRVINLSQDTHPFHVHLVQFQALSRDRYDIEGFDSALGGTTAP
jgi:Multicopper oxidase